MRLHHMLHYKETQANTAVLVILATGAPPEEFEEFGKSLGWDGLPFVVNAKRSPVSLALGTHRHRSLFGAVTDCIADQIDNHLHQSV